MEQHLIEQGYIPSDKSWIIRMGVLDIRNGYDDIIHYLEKQKPLSDDLRALYKVSIVWKTDDPLDVGESGTLYRFLKFSCWKLGFAKKFVKCGTLKKRQITDDPEIVNYTQKELLKLDNGTSQWASAAVLAGDEERIEKPPSKLKLTYEAVSHWRERRANNQSWEPRYDETILRQAVTYLKILKGEKPNFKPKHSEDYCFARAFGYVTKEEGEKRWPSLRGHESNRLKEMERALYQVDNGFEVTSNDHRVIQAVAMLQKIRGKEIKVKQLEAVNKSWPQFWKFLEDSLKLIEN